MKPLTDEDGAVHGYLVLPSDLVACQHCLRLEADLLRLRRGIRAIAKTVPMSALTRLRLRRLAE